MDLKELGQRLKKLRTDCHPGKSLVEFEILSGVSRGSILKIENGTMEFGPGIVTIDKWLKSCKTSLRDFFGAPSSADFENLPFVFQPQDTPFHQWLSDILVDRTDDLCNTTYVFLRELSRAAREHMQAKLAEQAAAARPESAIRRPRRTHRPKIGKRPLSRKSGTGHEQTGT
jgi:transcriptional regulator with XRE-family HTH domain